MEKQEQGRDAVLLTGATGALGSELLNELIARGYRVICLTRDRRDTAAKDRIRPLVKHDAFVKVIRGDIHAPFDYDNVDESFVWHTVHENLDALLAAVEAELAAG